MIKNKLIWSFVCVALISCGNATYEPQEYISTNLTDEKINLSKEVFKKLKQEHYIKNFVKNEKIKKFEKGKFTETAVVKNTLNGPGSESRADSISDLFVDRSSRLSTQADDVA